MPTAGEVIQFDVSKDNPQPFETVQINAKSFSTDLNRAAIAWYVNEKLISSGVGITSFSVKLGAAGSSTNVTMKVTTLEGATYQKEIQFTPAEVSLLWEAQGYVPPFYKGKAPFVRQGTVKITAVPIFKDKSGKMIDPSKLVYTWKQDYKTLGSNSGYGKQSLVISGGVIERPITIHVDVSSIDEIIRGEASIDLNPQSPQIAVYEDNPLYGILYNKSVRKNYPFTGTELHLITIPYFFSNTTLATNGINYDWSINNSDYPSLKNSTEITLRRKGTDQGSSLITIRATNLAQILQSAETSVSLLLSDRNAQSSPSL